MKKRNIPPRKGNRNTSTRMIDSERAENGRLREVDNQDVDKGELEVSIILANLI